jgi:hypothetical protein
MRPCLYLLLLLGFLPALATADSIRVIDLQGRTAAEMIPLIEPMLEPGDALTGNGFQLILRTSPENLARIEAVIQQLDQAPKRLRITVHMGELDEREENRHDFYLERSGSDVHIEAGTDTGGQGGLTVEQRGSEGMAGARIESTRRVRDAGNRQQVQALEGQPAYIASGVAFPYVSRVERYGPRSSSTAIDYRETSTGFYVLARLRGDGQVQLDISPRKENLSSRGGGMVETSALITHVSGPLDTWLELGNMGETRHRTDQDVTRTRRTRDSREEQMWLRVEVLD